MKQNISDDPSPANSNTSGNLEASLERQTRALEESQRNLRVLTEVNNRFASTLELKDLFQAATDGITALTGLDSAAVYLLSNDRVTLQTSTPPIPENLPDKFRTASLAEHTHIRRTLKTGEMQFILDTEEEALTEAEREVCEIRGLRSIYYFPIQLRGEPAGVLIVSSQDTPGEISPGQVELCKILVCQAALAVENAQIHKQIRDNSEKLEMLVQKRTAKLNTLVKAMTGREVRMAELKKVNRKLVTQLKEHGIQPTASDPLFDSDL